jgi:hypothetical protein
MRIRLSGNLCSAIGSTGSRRRPRRWHAEHCVLAQRVLCGRRARPLLVGSSLADGFGYAYSLRNRLAGAVRRRVPHVARYFGSRARRSVAAVELVSTGSALVTDDGEPLFSELRAVTMFSKLFARLAGGSATAVAIPAECDVTIDEMGIYLSGDMGSAERTRFVNHIRSCSDCHDRLLALELALSLAEHGEVVSAPEAHAFAAAAATVARPRTEAAAEPPSAAAPREAAFGA